MSSERSTAAPPEILFAQHLAANEKVHRDRALRKLQKYLFNHSSLPNGGFNESELLKIWKGLHYCMWMQDKPLIQEDLCDSISNLVHSFNNQHTALLFITSFYKTECREWTSIDKWRMDKFLMLLRKMLRQSFEFLKKKNWSEKLVRQFLGFISKYILHDHNHATSPDGVRFHLADVYLTELEKVSSGQLGPKQTITFLEPWIHMLVGINSKTLRAFVIKNVFGELIQQSPVMIGRPRKKGSLKLRVNYQLLADKLLEAGGSEECSSVNRPAIYNLVKNFRDVAQGKLPFAEEVQPDEVSVLDDDDIESAVQRLAEFTEQVQAENQAEKTRIKKRKRKNVDTDEAYGSDSAGEEQEEPQSQVARPTKNTSSRKKAERPEQKTGVLSKRLKMSLRAEEMYMDEDSDSAEENDGRIAKKGDQKLAKSSNKCLGSEIVNEEQNTSQDLKKFSKKMAKNVRSRKASNRSSANAAAKKDMGVSTEVLASPPVSAAVPAKPSVRQQKTKTSPTAREFDVEEFPEPCDDTDCFAGNVQPASEPPSFLESSVLKKNSSSATNDVHRPQNMSASKDLINKRCQSVGDFVSNPEAKAKYFKKAMSKTPTNTPKTESSIKTPVTRSQTKRLCFGKNSSVKKSAVKLRGSVSYDPSKTPEQGILKVNPIEPGTVIQVGKQATIKNTLRNSKFPQRMVAMDFF
ncbi:ribosomal RNA processing protein 1 homolog [Watersipora subatra]|uniref:ribosomal RNA processing protein 1 homolog n=1 Tax=Watersipora subatra TaxID=2589382 RepID=UPI00355BB70E